MSTPLLLAAILWAADPSFDVQARVVMGVEQRELPAKEVEPWIARAIRDAGFDKASPASDWVTLGPTLNRLFTTERGGTIIDGQVKTKDGRFEVEIHGCEGTPLVGAVSLVAGQRRVIRLTDGEEPRDYFVAVRIIARNNSPPKTNGKAGPTALIGIRGDSSDDFFRNSTLFISRRGPR